MFKGKQAGADGRKGVKEDTAKWFESDLSCNGKPLNSFCFFKGFFFFVLFLVMLIEIQFQIR